MKALLLCWVAAFSGMLSVPAFAESEDAPIIIVTGQGLEETSGAVAAALGVRALTIGPQIDPGVPWTRVLGPKPLLLALKSGNFGGPDFFSRALAMVQ